MEETKFTINSAPSSISFRCPHCEMGVEIKWQDVEHPEYWGDPWPDVDCPICGKSVQLGDWTYD